MNRNWRSWIETLRSYKGWWGEVKSGRSKGSKGTVLRIDFRNRFDRLLIFQSTIWDNIFVVDESRQFGKWTVWKCQNEWSLNFMDDWPGIQKWTVLQFVNLDLKQWFRTILISRPQFQDRPLTDTSRPLDSRTIHFKISGLLAV